MNNEQKYNVALERAKKELQACGSQDCDAARQIFRLFPELKESEDEEEKIRKGLKQGFSQYGNSFTTFGGIKVEDIIAWLEKQGEQKPNDKVKPKFKVGDWIILPLGITAHIDSLNSTDYQVTTTDGKICDFKISKQDNYRLWTIANAKDGDVLLEEEIGEPFIYNGNRAIYFSGYFLGAHCGICNGVFNPLGNNHHWGKNSCPATKEQRDLLFQKMKEAGYEWDGEKKELKKIKVNALDPDKVIAWLCNNSTLFGAKWCKTENILEQFKEDFGL